MQQNLKIKQKAIAFRTSNGFGHNEPIQFKSLIQKLNVLTVIKPLNEHFSGMAVKSGDHRFMMVNSNHPVGRQNFTICHELYHLFIQRNFQAQVCQTGTFDKIDEEERNADWFAAYLMMPDAGIMEMIPAHELVNRNRISLVTIVQIEQYFACSRKALLTRLASMDLIDFKRYDQFTRDVRASAMRYGFTPELYTADKRDEVIGGDYGVLAKQLHDQELISESHYINLLLDINIDLDSERLATSYE